MAVSPLTRVLLVKYRTTDRPENTSTPRSLATVHGTVGP
jgi:hypothetical protein